MSTMDGMEWRRHMLGAMEIVRQRITYGIPGGKDSGFICIFMGAWEALSAVTTGQTPFLDFLEVCSLTRSENADNRAIMLSPPVERGYYSPISQNQRTKEPSMFLLGPSTPSKDLSNVSYRESQSWLISHGFQHHRRWAIRQEVRKRELRRNSTV